MAGVPKKRSMRYGQGVNLGGGCTEAEMPALTPLPRVRLAAQPVVSQCASSLQSGYFAGTQHLVQLSRVLCDITAQQCSTGTD